MEKSDHCQHGNESYHRKYKTHTKKNLTFMTYALYGIVLSGLK